jgi:cell division control protein 7
LKFCHFNFFCVCVEHCAGTFSSVLKATSLFHPEHHVALKRVYPTCAPGRLANEMRLLRRCGGAAHVTPLYGCVFEPCGSITLVLPFMSHISFVEYLPYFTVSDTRAYLRALIEALRRLKQCGVIHRDIKPNNFLMSPRERKYLLVDFGLAENELSRKRGGAFPVPGNPAAKRARVQGDPSDGGSAGVGNTGGTTTGASAGTAPPLMSKPAVAVAPLIQPNAPRAGTRGFRAPEVLMRSKRQSCAIDMWSAGVILLAIMSGRFPFFHAGDDTTALYEIMCIFGSQALADMARQIGKEISVDKPVAGCGLRRLVTEGYAFPRDGSIPRAAPEDYPASAMELLARMLDVDPTTRITPEDALKHPFFTDAEKQVDDVDVIEIDAPQRSEPASGPGRVATAEEVASAAAEVSNAAAAEVSNAAAEATTTREHDAGTVDNAAATAGAAADDASAHVTPDAASARVTPGAASAHVTPDATSAHVTPDAASAHVTPDATSAHVTPDATRAPIAVAESVAVAASAVADPAAENSSTATIIGAAAAETAPPAVAEPNCTGGEDFRP